MAQYELSLYDYWRILKKRKFVVFLTIFAILISTAIYTNMQTPVYQAITTLKVEPTLIVPGITTEALGWDILTAINTEVKIIKSVMIAEKVGEKLGVINESTPEHIRKSIIEQIQGKLDAERVGDTNLIKIIATSDNNKEVASLANTCAEIYIERGKEMRSKRAKELREFIEKQVSEAKEKLRESEEKLRKYSEQTGAVGLGGHIALRIMDLETKKEELLKRYTSQHPEVIKISEQLKVLENQLKSLPKEEIEYARLTRELKLNEELYVLLEKRYKEALISEADRVQSAFIINPAIEPTKPVKPNLKSNLSIGFLAGILLGIVFAFIVEHLDTSIGTIEDVEKFLEISVVGVIPHIEFKEKTKKMIKLKTDKIEEFRNNLIIYHSMKSPFTEAYHTLRTNLKLGINNIKTILFTSAGVGEGKSLTAANFALAAAQGGIYTLLIESDLRRPSIHKVFGVPRIPGFSDYVLGIADYKKTIKGFTDFLLGKIRFDKIIYAQGMENFRLMTCGQIPSNPVNVLSSENLRNSIDELRNLFELVIIDVSPVLLFADALLLANYVDSVIVVYKVGKMARGALKRAKEQLLHVKSNVLGIVLNDIKASEMEPRYGYYYAYKYYMEREKKKL